MPPCEICGDGSGLGFTCNACGGKYCSRHRLPEAHQCHALRYTVSGSRPLESDGPDSSVPGLGRTVKRNLDPRRGSKGDTGRSAPTRTHRAGTRHGDQATNRVTSGRSRLRTLGVVLLAVLLAVTVGAAASGVDLPGPIDEGVADAVTRAPSVVAGLAANVTQSTPQSTTTDADGTTASPPSTTAPPTTSKQADAERVDTAAIERAIHVRVNEIRANNGLSSLQADDRIAAKAREHSQVMAAEGNLFHGDIKGRYGDACGSMGENVAYTYAAQDIRTDWAGVVNHHGNETAIAHGLVDGWMHSDGHRQNILRPGWSREGIGIATADTSQGVRVYATQGFCT